jgi:hypothetical protein
MSKVKIGDGAAVIRRKKRALTVGEAMNRVYADLLQESKQEHVDFYSTLYLALADLDRGSDPLYIVRNGRCYRREMSEVGA